MISFRSSATLAYLMNSSIVLGTTNVREPFELCAAGPGAGGTDAKPGGPSTQELEQYAQAEKSRLLERRAALLRAGQGRRRAVGTCAGEILGHPAGVQFREGPMRRFPLDPNSSCRSRLPWPWAYPTSPYSGWSGRAVTGTCGFSPIIPMTGEAVFEVQKVLRTRMRKWAWPWRNVLLAAVVNSPRSFWSFSGFRSNMMSRRIERTAKTSSA